LLSPVVAVLVTVWLANRKEERGHKLNLLATLIGMRHNPTSEEAVRAEMFKDRVGRIAGRPKVLILRMRHVPAIDSTGLHALRDVVRRSRHEGTLVVLSDVHAQPVVALERSGTYDELGEENVHGNIDDALNRARTHLGLPAMERPAFATPTVARETSPGIPAMP
jgi:SulP family sulfate permease